MIFLLRLVHRLKVPTAKSIYSKKKFKLFLEIGKLTGVREIAFLDFM